LKHYTIVGYASQLASRRVNAIKLRVRRRVYVEFGGNAISS